MLRPSHTLVPTPSFHPPPQSMYSPPPPPAPNIHVWHKNTSKGKLSVPQPTTPYATQHNSVRHTIQYPSQSLVTHHTNLRTLSQTQDPLTMQQILEYHRGPQQSPGKQVSSSTNEESSSDDELMSPIIPYGTGPRRDQRDQRTGLTIGTSDRHRQLLRDAQKFRGIKNNSTTFNAQEWLHHMTLRYPDPSTLRTMLAAFLGALQKQAAYQVPLDKQIITSPALKALIQGRIRMCDQRIRLEKPVMTPATSPSEVAMAISLALRLAHPLRPHLLLHIALLCLTAHRGSSITRLQLRDVVVTDGHPIDDGNRLNQLSNEACAHLTDSGAVVPQGCRRIAIIFRDTKTSAAIGNFALHVTVPVGLLDILGTVATMSRLEQHNSPHHQQFLFGENRYLVEKMCRALLPFRETRRGILRMLAFTLHVPPSDLLLFSRHTDVKRLRTYLGAGLFLNDEAAKTAPITSLIPSLIPTLML